MKAILLLVAVIGSIAVCAGNLDVAFVVDGSDSICGGPQTCAAWTSILNFIHQLVDKWEIGQSSTKVALATFGDQVTLKWNLDGFPDKAELESEIDNVEFPGGELMTKGVVKAIVARIFNESAGDRPDVPNVDVMITDGAPYVYSAAANSTANQATGPKVFVVCIAPGCDEGFAQSYSSPPKENHKNYFLVNNAGSIDDILEELFAQISALEQAK